MSRTVSTVSLSELQANLEDQARNLQLATKAKLKADQIYGESVELYTQAKVNLNAGVAAVKAATDVPNLYAS